MGLTGSQGQTPWWQSKSIVTGIAENAHFDPQECDKETYSGIGTPFLKLKAFPQQHTFSKALTPDNLKLENKTLKHMGLYGSFSYSLLHSSLWAPQTCSCIIMQKVFSTASKVSIVFQSQHYLVVQISKSLLRLKAISQL